MLFPFPNDETRKRYSYWMDGTAQTDRYYTRMPSGVLIMWFSSAAATAVGHARTDIRFASFHNKYSPQQEARHDFALFPLVKFFAYLLLGGCLGERILFAIKSASGNFPRIIPFTPIGTQI